MERNLNTIWIPENFEFSFDQNKDVVFYEDYDNSYSYVNFNKQIQTYFVDTNTLTLNLTPASYGKIDYNNYSFTTNSNINIDINLSHTFKFIAEDTLFFNEITFIFQKPIELQFHFSDNIENSQKNTNCYDIFIDTYDKNNIQIDFLYNSTTHFVISQINDDFFNVNLNNSTLLNFDILTYDDNYSYSILIYETKITHNVQEYIINVKMFEFYPHLFIDNTFYNIKTDETEHKVVLHHNFNSDFFNVTLQEIHNKVYLSHFDILTFDNNISSTYTFHSTLQNNCNVNDNFQVLFTISNDHYDFQPRNHIIELIRNSSTDSQPYFNNNSTITNITLQPKEYYYDFVKSNFTIGIESMVI